MDNTTRQLIAFAAKSSFDSLPPETVHECKRHIIDSFGCAFGAYGDDMSQMARAIASRSCPQSGSPVAKVWGSLAPASPELAAFANGVMLRLTDLSDMYGSRGAGHPSDVLPGIVAAAESVSASGKSMIAAVTLAYDVYCSLLDAIPLSSRGWDQPICVSIAATLAIGKLLQLSDQQLADAVALALAPSMALYQTRQGVLSSWKGAAAANASRNALFAVLLAKEGFSGPTAVFDGKSGFREVIGHFDWTLDAGSVTPHRITLSNIKSFPICYHGQSAAWAAISLHEEGIKTEDVIEIEVETYAAAIALMAGDASRWDPKTRDTADHSLPYVIATSLQYGEMSTRSFESELLNDVKVRSLMEKVLVSENPDLSRRYPASSPARLTVHLSTSPSRSILVEQPKGHIRNPMTDTDLESKFRDLFLSYGDVSHCERVLSALWNLEASPDVNDVTSLFIR